MVRRVDAHLGTMRHRSDVLEFRVEQHLDELADRMLALPATRHKGKRSASRVGK
jgi:hypothetical protein